MILNTLDKVSDNFIIATAFAANIGEVVFGDGNSSVFLMILSSVTLVIAVYKGRGAYYDSKSKKLQMQIQEEKLRLLKKDIDPDKYSAEEP
jgi:hypothetical protein